MGEGQDAEADRLWWRVPSRNPVAGTVEVDTPSGWTQPCALKY
jgi:hypothetical protein